MKGVVYLFFLFAYLFGITIQKEKKCFSYKNKDLCIEYNDIDDNCIVSYDYKIRNTITFSKLINIDKIDYKIHDDNILLVFFDSTNIYFNELTLANANIVNLYSQLTINQCTKQNNFDYSFNANNIISKYNVIGSLHCFSSSKEMAERFIKLGFYIGIGGVCTYKNAKEIKEVIKAIDLEYIILETDTPYLSPEPVRKEKNTPCNIPIIASYIASLKDVDLSIVSKVTSANASRLFDFFQEI